MHSDADVASEMGTQRVCASPWRQQRTDSCEGGHGLLGCLADGELVLQPLELHRDGLRAQARREGLRRVDVLLAASLGHRVPEQVMRPIGRHDEAVKVHLTVQSIHSAHSPMDRQHTQLIPQKQEGFH